MAMSLYDASITNYLQFLGALDGILAKGLAHCKEKSISPEELVEARLYPDMQHLRFQIQLVSHHCVHAIEAIKGGVFYPPRDLAALDYAGLQKMIVTRARRWKKKRLRRSMPAKGKTCYWILVNGNYLSRQRGSCSRCRCRIFIFTRRQRMTSCA